MTVDVVKVELTFDGVPEADEENPGGFLCLNGDDDNDDGTVDKDDVGPTTGEDDLRSLVVDVAGGLTEGTVELTLPEGADKVALYEDADRSGPVTLPDSWDMIELPVTLWVEGVETSSAARDVRLQADYTGPDGPCFDEVYLTELQVDLDVDSDRDGTISSGDSDEDTWTYGVGSNGAVILCNDDDDDNNGIADNTGADGDMINGPGGTYGKWPAS